MTVAAMGLGQSRNFWIGLAVILLTAGPARTQPLKNPILFVTQVPIPEEPFTIGTIFGNHLPFTYSVGRGGDLYILYPDTTLRNLTREAGYGNDGLQGANSIAVRNPSVHWGGKRALFSMVVGAPTTTEEEVETYWQIYEVTGLEKGATVSITKVPNQPADYNNVSPVYGSDDRVLFISDRPRDGRRHLYPQLDEYDSLPSNTGLWSLNLQTGDLILLDHSPSGDFTPIVDSFGRVIFTRWDHLQRDKQAEDDDFGADFGTFNYASESESAQPLANRIEFFPEPRAERPAILAGTNLVGHLFNAFIPWQINQDGTEAETINHVGRHELHYVIPPVFIDDPSLEEFHSTESGRFNQAIVEHLLQIRESPTSPGTYFATDSVYDGTHSSGRIISFRAPPKLPANQIAVSYVTHPDSFPVEFETPPPGHTGFYRNPLPLSDGGLVVVHTDNRRPDANLGTPENPVPRYHFRLKWTTADGSYLKAGAPLTPGIQRDVTYVHEYHPVRYSGEMWELDPVEVRQRSVPPYPTAQLPAVEQKVFTDEGVDLEAFRSYLRARDLALVVSRDLTTRDTADRQQPFNLQVAGSSTQTLGEDPGKLYQIAHLQFFQGDLIRGLGGPQEPQPGRRVLAQPLHDPKATNPPNPSGPPGSVKIASDGSMAAIVPARRAMTWQTTDSNGTPVVRERYWVTFQPGEVRVCASCHGLNSEDQSGSGEPQNPPQALRDLLQFWKAGNSGPGTPPPPQPGTCQTGPKTLCLSDSRFRVEARWESQDGKSGEAFAEPLTGDTGYFWFFDSQNVELVLKVLDACTIADRFWVFAGGLTNVKVDVTVTDTQAGGQKVYKNPQETAFTPIQDTAAFSICP